MSEKVGLTLKKLFLKTNFYREKSALDLLEKINSRGVILEKLSLDFSYSFVPYSVLRSCIFLM